MIRWLALLLALPFGALAQTTENASKLNSYVLLAPGPADSALASKTVTYVVLDSSPTQIGATKLNGYAVLDNNPNILGATKLSTYVVITPQTGTATTSFFRSFP